MTPEEKQKADAWMLLKDGDAVTDRIHGVMAAVFERPEVCSWVAGKMVSAETHTMHTPLKTYFEKQLERNLRMVLAEGVTDEKLALIMYPMIDEAVKRHAEQVSKDLAELKKLKSKGPIHGKR
jgi:hypothetical protein